MRNPLLSHENAPIEQLHDASYNRSGLELSQNLESLRARVGSILVGCGIISFLDACSERKRATHSKGPSRGKVLRREPDGTEVNSFNLNLVPLRQASLCLDCETITTTHTNCHACGSQALLNVARALNRQHFPDRVGSGRPSVVQMSVAHARPRDTFHRGAPNLGRNRGWDSVLPLKFDLSKSENSA